MTKSRMVHPTSDRHVTHVCVFDVGSDLCLICGAGSKTTGQEELEPLPEMGLSAAYKVAKEVRGTGAAMCCRRPWLTPACCAQEIAAVRLPTNRSSWKAKPQPMRLACVCLVRLPAARCRSRCRRRLGLTRGRALRRCACSSAPRCP